MIRTVQRLEFENVFPDEEEENLLYYLSKVSASSLLGIIGFSTTAPQPNFDNFITDQDVSWDVIQRVKKYGQENKITVKPEVISREGSLRLAEVILANRTELIEGNTNDNPTDDEVNLLKAFLIINKEVNSKQNFGTSESTIDKMIDMLLTMSFSSADIGQTSDINLEIGKLMYATIVKFEYLLNFLNGSEEYKFLRDALAKDFNEKNTDDLRKQVKSLFGALLNLKLNNSYKMKVEEPDRIRFLRTLVDADIQESEDFTNLKNNPIYIIEEDVFSIIDFFFAVDKFFKSIKFSLKTAYNKHFDLPDKSGDFFRFYTSDFSEEYMMQNILNEIFNQKHIHKLQESDTTANKPDYYVRNNNRLYLFEYKDILVRADIKSSSDIEKIKKMLKKKFVHDGSRDVGIRQLATSIEQIVNNEFMYDNYVNSKKNLTIYPVLLVSDRIFEILGMNFILNEWFKEEIKQRLGDKYNPNFIKDLAFIDIDTLIYWTPYLQKNFNNFREIIDNHHRAMRKEGKIDAIRLESRIAQANESFYNRLSPLSNRLPKYKFPQRLMVYKFKEVFVED